MATEKKSNSKAITSKASRSTNKTAQKTVKKAVEAPKEALEVKAKDVLAVNEDGSMEPLTKAFPEIDPEETVKVDVGEEAETTSQSATQTDPLTQGSQEEKQPSAAVPMAQQPVYQVVQEREPMVKMLYLDSCIENNQIPIGGGRIITGSGRMFSVKLSDFEGTFMTPLVTLLLRKRKFIVLDGLTKDQRIQYGVDYREGEIVKNEGMFDWFLTAPVKDAARVFEQLCPEHRELVARRFMSAHEKGDNRLTRDRIEALNKISKRDFEDRRGAFTPILEELNKAAL